MIEQKENILDIKKILFKKNYSGKKKCHTKKNTILSDSEIREDAFLFGECQGRVVVTIDRDLEDEFVECIEKTNVPFILLGHVTKGKVVIDDEHYGFINEFKEKFDLALEKRLV